MKFKGTTFGLLSKRWLIDHLFDRQLRAASPYIRGRVLDIGSGTERYRSLLNADSYIGFDRSGAAAVTGDACWLPFATAAIDTALCFQMIEDVGEPLRVLREIRRVLKPSGTLLLSADLSWRVHDAPHDHFRYTCYGLAHLGLKAGFKLESIEPLGGLWALVANRVAFRVYEGLGGYRLLRPFAWLIGCPILVCGVILDKLDFRPEDTKGYFVRATRWPEGQGAPPEPTLQRALSI